MTESTESPRLILLLATVALCSGAYAQAPAELSRVADGGRISSPASAAGTLPSVGPPDGALGVSVPRDPGFVPASALPSADNRSAGAPASTSPLLPRSTGDAIPRDLFELNKDATINVHGRPMRAGEVQKQISAVLSRAARGAPSLYRYPRRKPPGSTSEFGTASLPQFGAAALGGGRVSDLVRAPTGISPAGAMRPKPCPELTPEVARTRGAAEAGRSFVIEGYCLGDRPGNVELIGPFQGGRLQPAFQAWTEDRIVAVMPSLRGVPDQGVALVVTRADQARSSAYPIRFIAQRERVEVRPGMWSPDGNVDQTTASQDEGNIFSGFHATGIGGTIAGNFSLRVNPQCALDDLEIASTAGGVLSVTGFEAGPSNQADITVTYGPNCTTHTFDYVFGSESSTVCRVAFRLSTWASCPAGVPP